MSDSIGGGLVQLVNYGSQDVYLTATPEITFFRIIFRRYTNFGSSIREIPFDNEVTFGNNLTATIKKCDGDLLSKLVLRIKLPSIDLTYLNDVIMTQLKIDKDSLQEYLIYYNNLLKFINKLKNVVNNFFAKNDDTLTTYIQDLKDYILKYINPDEYFEFFITVDFFFNNKINTTQNRINTNLYKNSSLFKTVKTSLLYVYETSTNANYSFSLFRNMIYVNMGILDDLNSTCYQKFRDVLTQSNIITCGWVNKVAIALVEEIELSVGSNIIQKFSADYINIYGSLHYTNQKLYNTLIGDTDTVVKTELLKKEQYLYLPIPFYFCENYGLSFPLISVHYSTMQIKMKLASLSNLIYFEVSESNNTSVIDQVKEQIARLVFSGEINIFKTNLELSFLSEMIFLDSPERKKFSNSTSEYLISQIQEITFPDVNTYNNAFDIQMFHCTSQSFWILRQYKNVNNIVNKNDQFKYFISINPSSVTTEQKEYVAYVNVLYNGFVLFDLNVFINGVALATSFINVAPTVNNYVQVSVSPALESSLMLNGLPHAKFDYRYFNYLQDYVYYNNASELGLNVYSFALFPCSAIVSGSINLSILPKYSISMVIYNDISPVNNTLNLSKHNLNDYELVFISSSINVIRFIGGICGLAYSTY